MNNIFKPFFSVFGAENTIKEFFISIYFILFGWNLGRKIFDNSIQEFETYFKEIAGFKFSQSYGSGRMALFAILKSIDISEGDEVILQAFTCNVVPRAIKSAGAKPIYIDIDPVTFNMDIKLLSDAISEKTKAVIIQHSFGIPVDTDGIAEIIGRRDIVIIEDCAHSFDSFIDSDRLNIKSFSFFSTDHSKPLNTYLGGLVCTNSNDFYRGLMNVKPYSKKINRFLGIWIALSFLIEFITHRPHTYFFAKYFFAALNYFGLIFKWPDDHLIAQGSEINGLYEMSSFQAKIGISQLNRIQENKDHRIKAFNLMQKSIGWYKKIEPTPVLRYAFLVKNREEFIASYNDSLVLSTWFDSAISGGKEIYSEIDFDQSKFPVADFVSKHIINISVTSRVDTRYLEKYIQQQSNMKLHLVNYK
ncbi:DegT/DnrJ/EryC1/StrS family aminotransferase [Gammaproteobacteria bacterium]|nr:DegT/DnrJ/EryC1/StrS family aminotransferase [Gammaproteobacteria bacterium]